MILQTLSLILNAWSMSYMATQYDIMRFFSLKRIQVMTSKFHLSVEKKKKNEKESKKREKRNSSRCNLKLSSPTHITTLPNSIPVFNQLFLLLIDTEQLSHALHLGVHDVWQL